MIKGIWHLCFLIFKLVKQEVMTRRFHVPSPPSVLKKVNINGNIHHRYFTQKKKSSGANNCGQCVLEKNIDFIT